MMKELTGIVPYRDLPFTNAGLSYLTLEPRGSRAKESEKKRICDACLFVGNRCHTVPGAPACTTCRITNVRCQWTGVPTEPQYMPIDPARQMPDLLVHRARKTLNMRTDQIKALLQPPEGLPVDAEPPATKLRRHLVS